jgi:hypothetical protein
MLPPNIAALSPVADSCDLPFHDLAIMLPPNIAALSPVADSCDLCPSMILAIMLPPSIAALSPVADSCALERVRFREWTTGLRPIHSREFCEKQNKNTIILII